MSEEQENVSPLMPMGQQFPVMQLNVLPTGVLITIVYSVFKQEQIVIPREQAEQLAIQLVLQMSEDNFRQMMQMKREQVAEKQLIADVIKEKKLHD